MQPQATLSRDQIVYSFDAAAEPRLTIAAPATLLFETHDARGGRLKRPVERGWTAPLLEPVENRHVAVHEDGGVVLRRDGRHRFLAVGDDFAVVAELGQHLDVSRQAVNAIETGKHDPSLPLAFRIARLFEMTIEEIFDDER